MYCSHEPHKRNKNWYWGCSYTSCPKPEDHEDTACVGSCGNLGPERWAVPDTYGNISYGTIKKKRPYTGNGWQLATIVEHKTRCGVRLQGSDWTCGYHYYKCNSSNTCPNALNHAGSSNPPPTDNTPNCDDCTDGGSCCGASDDPPPSENPVVPPPPTPTPSPSPTYHACGEHETSVSGDHSLQASCTSTDSNGNTCTVTSFYACDSHTHAYPAPPPPPTTVACGGASYTGCSGASSRTEHHVPLCSKGCGKGYWTCGEYAYQHTDEKTCRREGCDARLTECQNGPSKCVRPGKAAAWHWL